MKTTISYGKCRIPVYRVNAHAMSGLQPIPESSFTHKDNRLIALEIDVEVFGTNVLPAYTAGDNTHVVATDTMKNFTISEALAFDGATIEQFLAYLGRRFLTTYPQMESLRLTAREQSFIAATVPQDSGAGFVASSVLFSRLLSDYTYASLDIAGGASSSPTVTSHRCGRVGLELIKTTGSAFTRFARDDYTTLPERADRPLFIHLDLHWTYSDISDLLSPDLSCYIAAEQVRDVVASVFHEMVSESIQHLVYAMGTRLLMRFPQMARISFAAQNRTWEPFAADDANPNIHVYTDPFPAYGLITLTLSRDE